MIHLLWCIINFTDLYKYSDKELKYFHTRTLFAERFVVYLRCLVSPLFWTLKSWGAEMKIYCQRHPVPHPSGWVVMPL